jgi:hypothetical protein
MILRKSMKSCTVCFSWRQEFLFDSIPRESGAHSSNNLAAFLGVVWFNHIMMPVMVQLLGPITKKALETRQIIEFNNFNEIT